MCRITIRLQEMYNFKYHLYKIKHGIIDNNEGRGPLTFISHEKLGRKIVLNDVKRIVLLKKSQIGVIYNFYFDRNDIYHIDGHFYMFFCRMCVSKKYKQPKFNYCDDIEIQFTSQQK